ncbi:hypothetical protein A8135_12810 [Legionella jamestowniensis]|uniref:Uncharacterized protein n=1 Tax=Legionella jamestowniensis TaxID=455 RepID=A0ABX2XUY4_9GAMM|nr:hypothetical protein [Legionella jamestowniensis]OCH98424.1 hypothetical protein A8135_12810 [Legionella jamestowniensis]
MTQRNENNKPGHHDQQGRHSNQAPNRDKSYSHNPDSNPRHSSRDERDQNDKAGKHFSDRKPMDNQYRGSESPRDHRK